MKNDPVEIPNIQNITVSGRIATGKTTLSRHIAEKLGWKILNGGEIFRDLAKEMGIPLVDTDKRPDQFDKAFEEKVKKILSEEKNYVIQSHLAGFDAQGIYGVYKILTSCEGIDSEEMTDIRIERVRVRENLSPEEARKEVVDREIQNLEKFRRLYAGGDNTWVYWDEKYYDLTVDTFTMTEEQALEFVLAHLLAKE